MPGSNVSSNEGYTPGKKGGVLSCAIGAAIDSKVGIGQDKLMAFVPRIGNYLSKTQN